MRQNKNEPYLRGDALRFQFNEFWNRALKTSGENYFGRLTSEDFIGLKKAISCINNILTLKATLQFIDRIRKCRIINRGQAAKMRDAVEQQHPNTTGFDVKFDDGTTRIIAEVKCSIPVNGDKFGSRQKTSILTDLTGLENGKKKGDVKNLSAYYKFMVILDVCNAREAMKNLMQDKFIELKGNNVDTHHVFVVFVNV